MESIIAMEKGKGLKSKPSWIKCFNPYFFSIGTLIYFHIAMPMLVTKATSFHNGMPLELAWLAICQVLLATRRFKVAPTGKELTSLQEPLYQPWFRAENFTMDQAGPSSSNQDPRFDFIGSYAVKSLKLKPEKWMRVLGIEEHRLTLNDFVNRPLPMLLVVVLTHAAQLVPVISFPCYLKNKAVYFVKKKPDVVPKENCSEMVIFGK